MSPHDLRPETRAALARGRALYLAGRFFEAHEAWEDAWRVEKGPVRVFLQALIQIAAGFVKALRDGRPAGALKHFECAAERLALFPDAFAGVAVRPLRDDLALAIAAAERWNEGAAKKLDARPPRLERAPDEPRAV
jgi:uncharacterized protein